MEENNSSIGFRVRKLDNQLKRNMQLALNSRDDVDEITAMNGFILQYLACHAKDKIYQKDIEQKFKIGRSAVTNLLNRMEENGLIQREVEKSDARLKRIALTEKGREQQKIVQSSVEWLDYKQMEQITPEEKEIFFSILEKIEKNVSDVTGIILGPDKGWIQEVTKNKKKKEG